MKLKLSTGNAAASDGQSGVPPSATAPAPPTPASTGSGGGFKLKLNASQPPTPATEQPVSTANPANAKKPPQQRKSRKPAQPSGRKRAANDDTISPAAKRPANGGGPARKFSLKIGTAAAAAAQGGDDVPQSAGGLSKLMLKRRSTAPKLRALNAKRPPPPRLPGLGYDSEDSEAEEDPAIQQSFILRMQPGEDCDYIREAIANGKIGAPPNEDPAQVSMRFIDKDFRRATVTVRGRMYAAALVDLPCIVETMKSWDKKGWWKVADVCQMLLVLGRCSSDDEAKNYPLPREVDKESLQYAHGLTPPMHWVRKRRFRKRLSYKTIANVDEEVERLLKEDEQAENQGGEVTLETFDRAELERSQEPSGYEDEEDEDADADGEAIATVENGQEEYEEYFSDEGNDDLVDNLQAMFDEDTTSAAPPAATELVTDSPAPIADTAASLAAVENALDAETPTQDITTQDEASSSSGSDDEEDDDDSPDVMDEDALAKAAERNQQLEEVADLEREVENQRVKVAGISNQLLKQRAVAQLRVLEEDLRVKKGVFGLDDGGDEVEED